MKSEASFISKRSSLVEWSGIRTMSGLVKESGPGTISLGIGQPDFNTPDHIIAAAKRALDEGYTRVSSCQGVRRLKNRHFKKAVSKEWDKGRPGQ